MRFLENTNGDCTCKVSLWESVEQLLPSFRKRRGEEEERGEEEKRNEGRIRGGRKRIKKTTGKGGEREKGATNSFQWVKIPTVFILSL